MSYPDNKAEARWLAHLDQRMCDNFEAKLVRLPFSGCVIWDGNINNQGYGVFTIRRAPYQWKVLAHRFAWTVKNGQIPDRMLGCHRCDVPSCCNPDHIFLGSNSDNMRDAIAKGRWHSWQADKNRCLRGHEFTEENTQIFKGGRSCRACQRLRYWERYRDRYLAKRKDNVERIAA